MFQRELQRLGLVVSDDSDEYDDDDDEDDDENDERNEQPIVIDDVDFSSYEDVDDDISTRELEFEDVE